MANRDSSRHRLDRPKLGSKLMWQAAENRPTRPPPLLHHQARLADRGLGDGAEGAHELEIEAGGGWSTGPYKSLAGGGGGLGR